MPLARLIDAVVLCSTFLGGEIVHVDDDASPGGDGQTWGSAFRHLQDALVQESSVQLEVRVAQGTYRPDRSELHPDGNGDRQAAFDLPGGVVIKGGYAGIQSANPDVRDPGVHRTILSGDLNGDDEPDFGSYDENSLHVVLVDTVSQTVTLDGVTVTAGNTTWTLCCMHGAGMRAVQADVLLRDCRFTANLGAIAPGGDGGGLYLSQCNVVMERCVFDGNNAVKGGAVYIRGSQADLSDCVFTGNFGGNGGAVHTAESGLVMLRDCVFIGNEALVNAGGIKVGGSGPTYIVDGVFDDNTAGASGGGVQLTHSATLLRCRLTANEAPVGGGLHNRPLVNVESEATLVGCRFRNHATGGAVYNDGQLGGDPLTTAVNCVIENSVSGGVINWSGGTSFLRNCTLVGNHPAVFNSSSADFATIRNCILWAAQPQPDQIVGGMASVTHSCVRGWHLDVDDQANTGADPQMLDLALENYSLGAGSPCIDAGSNEGFPEEITTDFLGNPRFIDVAGVRNGQPGECLAADMGAYEFQEGTTVCCEADTNGDGTVDTTDLVQIVLDWGCHGTATACAGDVNADGFVDVQDLLAVVLGWGDCPSFTDPPG